MTFQLAPIKLVKKELLRDDKDQFMKALKKIADRSIRCIRDGKGNIFKYNEPEGKLYVLVRYGKSPIYGLVHDKITSLPFAVKITISYFEDLATGRIDPSHLELIKNAFDDKKPTQKPRGKKITFLED